MSKNNNKNNNNNNTFSSLLQVLKSAVCLRIAVTVVAKTSCVVTELIDAALFVRNTYYGQKRHFS